MVIVLKWCIWLNGCGGFRTGCGTTIAQKRFSTLYQADNSIGRGNHDRQKDHTNERVETIAVVDISSESVEDRENERAYDRTNWLAKAAVHSHDLDADRGMGGHGTGRDSNVVKGKQHAADPRNETGKAKRRNSMQDDIEAKR